MITLKYSLVIEATADPNFFGFFSPELEGFSGVGRSLDECLERAAAGMDEHVRLLREQRLPVPETNPNPRIVIQNQQRLARAAGF